MYKYFLCRHVCMCGWTIEGGGGCCLVDGPFSLHSSSSAQAHLISVQLILMMTYVSDYCTLTSKCAAELFWLIVDIFRASFCNEPTAEMFGWWQRN